MTFWFWRWNRRVHEKFNFPVETKEWLCSSRVSCRIFPALVGRSVGFLSLKFVFSFLSLPRWSRRQRLKPRGAFRNELPWTLTTSFKVDFSFALPLACCCSLPTHFPNRSSAGTKRDRCWLRISGKSTFKVMQWPTDKVVRNLRNALAEKIDKEALFDDGIQDHAF